MYTKPKLKKTLGQKIALAVIPFAIIFANIISEVGYDLAEEEHTITDSERKDTIFGGVFHVYVIHGEIEEIQIKEGYYDRCGIYEYDIPDGEKEWGRIRCWELNYEVYVRYVGDVVEVAVSEAPDEIEYRTEDYFVSDVIDTVFALLWLAIPGSVIAYFYLGRMNKERHA